MTDLPNIKVLPPGPKSRSVIERDLIFMSPSISRLYPLVVASGDGCTIKDEDENEYVDFNAGYGNINVGHSHPLIIESVNQQVKKLINYSSAFYSEVSIRLSEELNAIIPGNTDKKIFYSNSGSEAVEAGIKTVMWHTRKHNFLAFQGGYHGSTLGALSFSALKPSSVRYFSTACAVNHVPYPYCYRCSFNQKFPECHYWCIDYIDDAVIKSSRADFTGILFEPIQAQAGCIVPPPEYFKRLKRLTDRHNILLIDDEVQTSLGRIGRWFGIEAWGVDPDILCLGGSLSSGFPLGTTIANSELMDWDPGSHISTLGGNPVACAAALTVLELIKSEHLLENSTRLGNYILRRLRELAEKYEVIGDVRGKGLMIGLEIVENSTSKEPAPVLAQKIIQKSFRRGVLLAKSGSSVVQISPPLTINKDLLDQGMQIIESAISEVVDQV